jgi:Domain of unknown function (DUF927)
MPVMPFRNSGPEPVPMDTPFEIPDWFRFTWCRWNHTTRKAGRDRDGQTRIRYIKKFALEGEVESYAYGTFCAFPREMDTQPGLICAPHARFLVAECDDDDEFDLALLGDNPVPTVRSSRGFHYYHAVPPELTHLMPSDGPLPGGDLQTAGFVPAPGCTHPSGAVYTLVADHLPVADEAMLLRLRAARTRQNERQREVYRERGGTGGYDGSGINGQDDYLAKEICWKLVAQGLPEAGVREIWEREAAQLPLRDPSDPFTGDDFTRHYAGAMRKYARMQEREAAPVRALTSWKPMLAAAEESEETVTDEPFPPSPFRPGAGAFRISDGQVVEEVLLRKGTDIRLVAYCPMYVSRRMFDDKGEIQYEISWKAYDGQLMRSCAAAADIRNHTRLLTVFPEAVVTSTEAPALSRYLTKYIQVHADVLHANQVRIATSLGWQSGTDLFVSGDGRPCEVRDVSNLGHWMSGHAQGGSLDTWITALAHAPWRVVALTAGALAAPLLRILDVPGFVIDSASETTRGKTRAARVAASVWGDPGKLLLSWSDTKVALETYAGAARGVAIVIDDSKLARSGNQIAEIVYQVASGMTAGKAERSGSRLQERHRIEVVVITNGEQPLLAASERSDGGAAARVVGLWGPPFESAGQADMMDAVVAEHYGHAGETFVSWLLGMDAEDIRARYRVLREKAQAEAETGVAKRRGSAIAVLRLAAELAHEAGLLPEIAGEHWTEILAERPGEEGSDDLPAAALELLWREVLMNRRLFWERRNGTGIMSHAIAPNGGYAGRLEVSEGWVAVRPEWLKKFLGDAKYEGEGILRSWGERGWIARTKDGRRAVPVRLSGVTTKLVKVMHGITETGLQESLEASITDS